VGKAASAVALSPDGALLAASDVRGQVSMWRVADPSRPVPVELANAKVADSRKLAFSGDGRYLAASSATGTVSLWRTDSGAIPTVLDVPGQDLRAVAFSPTADLLAAAGDDGQVHLWRLGATTGPHPLSPLTGPTSRIHDIAFAPDSRTVAAATAG
jgi:WD40 repeat protein